MRLSKGTTAHRFNATTKPELIDQGDIDGVRKATKAENTVQIDVTNKWPIFVDNIDSNGKPDTQCAVECCAQLSQVPGEQWPGRAAQCAQRYVANQHRALMIDVLKQFHKQTCKEHKKKVADWSEWYLMSVKWEAFFLFLYHILQENEELNAAEQFGSKFIGLPTYKLLREQFISCMDEMG